jgi:UDP-N-acetylmuramoyl-L-alanyl-D-glutamate--2,6-diaminopimelate ligase
LTRCGKKTALLSNIESDAEKGVYITSNTTPDLISLYRHARLACDDGCEAFVMEVSSHGIHQRRIQGVPFRYACFTNISHDHLDYHGTFSEYQRVKKQFLDSLDNSAILVACSQDKAMYEYMTRDVQARIVPFEYNASMCIGKQNGGCLVDIDGCLIETSLEASFMISNLVGAIRIVQSIGQSLGAIKDIVPHIKPPQGRCQMVKDKDNRRAIVDYAHTPDALEKILKAYQGYRLVTVFGCGGERDATKRPLMYACAQKYSDIVIVTSDNPRNENQDAIARDVFYPHSIPDSPQYIPDRRQAIRYAKSLISKDDIDTTLVVIAGKGHEHYQIIGSRTEHFSDQEEWCV